MHAARTPRLRDVFVKLERMLFLVSMPIIVGIFLLKNLPTCGGILACVSLVFKDLDSQHFEYCFEAVVFTEMRIPTLKLTLFLLLATCALSATHAGIPRSRSARAADAMILAQETAKSDRAAEQKQRLLAVPAISTTTHHSGGRTITARRVETPVLSEVVPVESTRASLPLTSSDAPDFPELPTKAYENLQLHATVYDDTYSKITLTYKKELYTIWANVNFNYLRNIGSFERANINYSYFGFTDNISSAVEKDRVEATAKEGYAYTSRWEKPPVAFNSREPEYIIVTEEGREIPEAVTRQFDDLMSYYVANAEALRIAYQRATALQAARERYKAEHPEQLEKDFILNYARVNRVSKGHKK